MAKIQLIVFDMAGTTVYDKGAVANAFMQAFREFGIETTREEVKKVMGRRKKDAIRILLRKFRPGTTEGEDNIIEKIHDSFISSMIRFYETDQDLCPQPFAENLFEQLKKRGIKISLNTGFTRGITDTILKRLGWEEGRELDAVISSDEVANGRPYPDMIRALMQRLHVPSADAVAKVGDTDVDVEEGRNAGCGLVVSVTTGAFSKEQLEKYHPDHIIDSLAELPALIESID